MEMNVSFFGDKPVTWAMAWQGTTYTSWKAFRDSTLYKNKINDKVINLNKNRYYLMLQKKLENMKE